VRSTVEKQQITLAKTLESQQITLAKTIAVVIRDIAKTAYDQTVGPTAQLRKFNNTVNTGALAIKKAMVKDSLLTHLLFLKKS
jgi:hypothetical protein